MAKAPFGCCQCGCGAQTKIAKRTDKQHGRTIKGQPLRYISGHYWRDPDHLSWRGGRRRLFNGYVMVYEPDRLGRVFEHTIVAERALGKRLPPGACVHHVNGNRADNRPENLVVCPDRAYHTMIHRRERALEECGNANWRKCTICKTYDDPDNLVFYGKHVMHRDCNYEQCRQRRGSIKKRARRYPSGAT